MSPVLVSAEDAACMIAARVAQLDQAIAVLGVDTVLGAGLAGTRDAWLSAQRHLARHPESCSAGGPVECLLWQVLTATPRNPFMKVAGDELMVTLTGCTTVTQMRAWLAERSTP